MNSDGRFMNSSPCNEVFRRTTISLLLLFLAHSASAETVLGQRFYPAPTETRLQVGTEELRDNYSALAGLEGLYIDFSVVKVSGKDKGIWVYEDLEDRVREKVLAAGLKMLTEEEVMATPGLPVLNLWPAYDGVDNDNTDVRIDENECRIEPNCRTSLWAGYSESASILRRPGLYHRLSTWGSGDQTTSCADRGAWMSEAVLEKIDLFLSDFKKAQIPTELATVYQESDVPENCNQPWVIQSEVFSAGKAELSDVAKPIFDKMVSVSNKCPSTSYTLETHADTRAAKQYNMVLTVARAHTIKEYLVSKGLQFSRVQTRPMGESQPISNGRTAEDHAANRRVVILPSGGEAVQTASSDQ